MKENLKKVTNSQTDKLNNIQKFSPSVINKTNFFLCVMRAVRRRELTPPHSTHHRHTKHTLPHENNAVFINILNILKIE